VLLLLLLVAIPVGIAVWFVIGQDWWRRRRRAALARQPFPSHWQDWLRTRTSIYARVPPELLPRLQELIRIFVGEKTFVGCNGLTVTEEMRVVIAAYACLLVTNRPDVPRSHFYDDLFSILVYPTPFIVPHTHRDGHGVITEGHRVLSGQAWDSRRIIVSWQDVEEGLATGHNVVLHEFAHYLDMEDETMDGAPGLGSVRA
jgi:Mlc titration factor MtfA (ptsG expression regulator)